MPLPMHTGGMKRGFSAGGPGLVGLRLTQVSRAVLLLIGVHLKTRKLSGLWDICEQQGPDTAGGSAHHCRTGLAGGKREGCRELSAKDDDTVRNERQMQVPVVTGRAKDNGTWRGRGTEHRDCQCGGSGHWMQTRERELAR